MLLSAAQQSESVIHIHISTVLDSIPILVITKYRVEFPVLDSRFLLLIYFMCSSVYMPIIIVFNIIIQN